MGNSRSSRPPQPSLIYTRPPGNWDYLYTVVAIGANVYQPKTVIPLINAFRPSNLTTNMNAWPLPRCCSVKVDDKKIRLEIFNDSGACSSSGILVNDIIKNKDGIIIVYDYTFDSSFEFAKKLTQDIIIQYTTNTKNSLSMMMCGVNGEISRSRKVEYSHAKDFADEHNVPLFEVDLDSEMDVEKAYMTLVELMIKRS